MKSKRLYQILCVAIFIFAFVRPINDVLQRKDMFFSRGFMAHFSDYEKAYYNSQYVKKDNPGIIPDETFEAFVGGAFLRGTNPILIVHEHPPLGRYIIALSLFLFDNPSRIILPALLLSFLGIFLIGRLILKDALLALLPLGVFINEPLVINKLHFTPLLEPIQLPFIVFALYFFIKGLEEKKYFYWFMLTSLMLGAVVSIRFFILGFAEVLAMVAYLILSGNLNKKLLHFLATLPLALVVLILSYTKTIQDGYSIWQVFAVQKYIFFYHQSQLITPFSFWDLLLFNKWHAWWADRLIISDSNWILLWPAATFLTVSFIVLLLLKKTKTNAAGKVLLLWIISYCLLLSGGNSTTRYFLPLLPFLYIFSTALLLIGFKKMKKRL